VGKKNQKPQQLEPILGRVEPVDRILVSASEAGELIAKSDSKMREMRTLDSVLIDMGRPPEGPPWVTIGKGVYYRVDDLREWVARTATVRGRVPWRGAPKKCAEQAEPA